VGGTATQSATNGTEENRSGQVVVENVAPGLGGDAHARAFLTWAIVASAVRGRLGLGAVA
jgi:hypothetical protein